VKSVTDEGILTFCDVGGPSSPLSLVGGNLLCISYEELIEDQDQKRKRISSIETKYDQEKKKKMNEEEETKNQSIGQKIKRRISTHHLFSSSSSQKEEEEKKRKLLEEEKRRKTTKLKRVITSQFYSLQSSTIDKNEESKETPPSSQQQQQGPRLIPVGPSFPSISTLAWSNDGKFVSCLVKQEIFILFLSLTTSNQLYFGFLIILSFYHLIYFLIYHLNF